LSAEETLTFSPERLERTQLATRLQAERQAVTEESESSLQVLELWAISSLPVLHAFGIWKLTGVTILDP
jgi:hypothetical protein